MRIDPRRRPASPIPVREAFLLPPGWREDGWRATVAAYLRTFAPAEPVALIVPVELGPGRPTLEAIGEEVMEVVASTGLADVPEVLVVDAAAELLGTLRRFERLHPVTRSLASASGTPAAERLAAALGSAGRPARAGA